MRGKAYIDNDGIRHDEPKDFAGLNALPLIAQQEMLKALIFPGAVPEKLGWAISPEDRRFVLDAMSCEPGDSPSPLYDRKKYHDRYAKFFLYGSDPEAEVSPAVRSFGKSGLAYGYVVDNAYVADREERIEFLLSAVVYTNANQTFNDDQYEYEKVAIPFMRDLGKLIYQHELRRPREHRPSGFPFD